MDKNMCFFQTANNIVTLYLYFIKKKVNKKKLFAIVLGQELSMFKKSL